MNRKSKRSNCRYVPQNIVEFIQNPNLLNDKALSEAQIACLKSIYGLPLTDHELEIYRQGTGRTTYPGVETRAATIIAGRRGGKTKKIAATIALYQAFRDHRLPLGEKGYVMLLAPTLELAKIAFEYICAYLRGSKILWKRVRKINKNSITLDNHITIGCYACTHAGVRGRTVVAAVCDEIGFWPDGPEAANAAEEVISAVTPGMATVRKAKLIKISTPYAKRGLLWNEFRRRSELPFPVWQLTSFDMNPALRPESLEDERRESEEKYRREYLAEFTDAINAWVDPEILDPCIVRGRQRLPRQDGVSYFAALDPASRGSEFALLVLHQSADGLVVVDYVGGWQGTRQAPLSFDSVLPQIRDILASYEINTVVGDLHCADCIKQSLMGLGIFYETRNFGGSTRAEIFLNLKHLMVRGKLQLVDDPSLIHQLRSLNEVRTPSGQTDVRPHGEVKDDRAVVLALAAREAVSRQPVRLTIELGLTDISLISTRIRLNPDCCAYAARCANYPTCTDAGYCLNFIDQQVPDP